MRMSYLRFRALSSLFLAFTTLALHAHAQRQSSTQSFQFMNPAFPVDQRVNDLIGRMTLEEKVSQMRDHAPAIPRLGVPKYDWWNEGLHGVAFAGYATNFPQVIGMAATWDTSLVHRMGETTSTEARAKYNQAMREDHMRCSSGLLSGPPTSISFATRAGAVAKRPMGKILSSPAAWAWPLSPAFRATIPNT